MFRLDLADPCTKGARPWVSEHVPQLPSEGVPPLWAPRAAFTGQDHGPGQASVLALFSPWTRSQVQALATGSGLFLPKPRGCGAAGKGVRSRPGAGRVQGQGRPGPPGSVSVRDLLCLGEEII